MVRWTLEGLEKYKQVIKGATKSRAKEERRRKYKLDKLGELKPTKDEKRFIRMLEIKTPKR